VHGVPADADVRAIRRPIAIEGEGLGRERVAIEQRAAPERRDEVSGDRVERRVVRPVEAVDQILADAGIEVAQGPAVGRPCIDDALAARFRRFLLRVAESLRVDDQPREPVDEPRRAVVAEPREKVVGVPVREANELVPQGPVVDRQPGPDVGWDAGGGMGDVGEERAALGRRRQDLERRVEGSAQAASPPRSSSSMPDPSASSG
jgi:hypothetical protein